MGARLESDREWSGDHDEQAYRIIEAEANRLMEWHQHVLIMVSKGDDVYYDAFGDDRICVTELARSWAHPGLPGCGTDTIEPGIVEAATRLRAHFGEVQIFASSFLPDNPPGQQTTGFACGYGNLLTRLGMARRFVSREDRDALMRDQE